MKSILSLILLLSFFAAGQSRAQLLATSIENETTLEDVGYEYGIQIIPNTYASYDSISQQKLPFKAIPVNAKIYVHDDRESLNLVKSLKSSNPIYLKSKNDLIPLIIEVIDSTSTDLNYAILRPSRQMLPGKKYILYFPAYWEYQKKKEFTEESPFVWFTSQKSDFEKPILNGISIEGGYGYDSTVIPEYSFTMGDISIDSEEDEVYVKVSIKSNDFNKFRVFYLKLDTDRLKISSILKDILYIGNGDTCEVKIQLVDICGNMSVEKKAKFVFVDDSSDQEIENHGYGPGCCVGINENECGGHGFWDPGLIVCLIVFLSLIIILFRRIRKYKKVSNNKTDLDKNNQEPV